MDYNTGFKAIRLQWIFSSEQMDRPKQL